MTDSFMANSFGTQKFIIIILLHHDSGLYVGQSENIAKCTAIMIAITTIINPIKDLMGE